MAAGGMEDQWLPHLIKENEKMETFSTCPNITIRNFIDDTDYLPMRELWLACRDSRGLEGAVTVDDLKNQAHWMQNFDPCCQQFFIYDNSALIGCCSYNWSEMSENLSVFHMEGTLLPNYWQSELPNAMLELMEGYSLTQAASFPTSRQCFFSAWLPQRAESILNFYLSHGYQKTRYFIEMLRPTSIPMPEHSLPQGLEIRPVTEEQLRPIYEAENEANRDHWGHIEGSDEQYQAWLNDRRRQPDLWKVAWQDDQVCGMVRNYIDALENEEQQRLRGYTEFISVRRPWRGKGVAKALIAASIRMFTAMGIQETALGVDTENPSAALALYQKMGYTENPDKTFLVITKPLLRSNTENQTS